MAKVVLKFSDFFAHSIKYQVADFEENIELELPLTARQKKEVLLGNDKFLWNGLTVEKLNSEKSERFFLNSIKFM